MLHDLTLFFRHITKISIFPAYYRRAVVLGVEPNDVEKNFFKLGKQKELGGGGVSLVKAICVFGAYDSLKLSFPVDRLKDKLLNNCGTVMRGPGSLMARLHIKCRFFSACRLGTVPVDVWQQF